MIRHGFIASALGLVLIFGCWISGSWGAGPSASAEGPASVFSGAVFYGYVFAETPSTLPDRVQALGAGGAVCGSADVVRLSDTVGYYAMSVVSSDLKRGCPSRGGAVQFSLLSGRIDDGALAEQVATLEPSEAPHLVNLSVPSRALPNWSGTPGNVDGGSLLRWTGAATSLGDALTALPFQTGAVYRLDPQQGMFVEVTPATGTVLAAGDLLLVRFR